MEMQNYIGFAPMNVLSEQLVKENKFKKAFLFTGAISFFALLLTAYFEFSGVINNALINGALGTVLALASVVSFNKAKKIEAKKVAIAIEIIEFF